MAKTVPIYVIERRGKDKTIAARGFGWPNGHVTETAKNNQQFVDEMNRLKNKIDPEEHDPETKVAEFTVRDRDKAICEVEILV
jgi:hypothetical protein